MSERPFLLNIQHLVSRASSTRLDVMSASEFEDASTHVTGNSETVLLQTANGYIADEKERRMQPVKILLDSCSQQTYVSQKVVKNLELNPIREVSMNIKAFGSNEGKDMLLKEYQIVLKPKNKSSSMYMKALAIPSICAPISGQNLKLAMEQNEFLNNLNLADNGDNTKCEIDLLIGANVYWKVVNGNLKKDNHTWLTVISSMLGWLINGPVTSNQITKSVNMNISHVMKVQCEKNEEKLLSEEISNFWNLDVIGISEDETAKEENFSIKFENGRYKVELPFKESHLQLADHYTLSKKCLEQLKSRLDKNEELKRNYDDVIQEQLNCGVIEKVEDAGSIGNVTYLPHREIIRNDKTSTKLRIVFDASAKRTNYVSLNEVLYKGPSLNPNLYDLLLKFRIYLIVMTADIEKAYLQINIEEKHRDYMRFLWFEDIFANEPKLQKYRFCRVIFGVTSSQFLLNATIRAHAQHYESVDPEFARKVRNHFYVDDLTTGVNTVKEGYELYKKFKIRFMEAQFNIRKWRTNNTELRNLIADDDVLDEENAKVLGIRWNQTEDTLELGVNEIFVKADGIKPTKRNILKVIASIYDPVGYIQPVVIKLKLLFQEICLANIDWDNHIGDLEKKWVFIVKGLKTFANLKLERCYYIQNMNDPVDNIYLHGFSDASVVAFGACVYLKAVTRSGNINVSLVTAKSRVVPIKKKYTVPRLELLGNYILAKLIMVVHRALSEEIHVNDLFCWTDSMVTLAWIKSIDREFKVFVQNRVNKIREYVIPSKWNYCSTKDNPADITRFNSCNLNENMMWKEGPSMIKMVIPSTIICMNSQAENIITRCS